MLTSTSTDCPSCGAPIPGASLHPGATVTCSYCRESFRVAQPPPPAGDPAAAAAAASEPPLATRGADPLPSLAVKGMWASIRSGHELLALGPDRLLDWEPSSGRYHIWVYDRNVSDGDPLPRAHAEGSWSSIRAGHTLIWLGGGHLLDWEPASGSYRVWSYDASATGQADVLPNVLASGRWSSIGASKKLVYLGRDQLLDWEPSSGHYRIWRYDRAMSGDDPLPGAPLCEGAWQSIRSGHELIMCGGDHLLDWTPGAGNYRIWRADASAGGDPLPDELAAGNWSSIRSGHRLIYLDGDRVLDWEPDTGAYRIWVYQRNLT